MISVLRQEWKARKHTIALISGALFIFTVIGMPLGIFGTDDETRLPFHIFSIILLAAGVPLTVGSVVFIPLLKGAGNIGTDLLSDRGYLLLSLPKKTAVLFAGKMIIGLAEFLIYAVPIFFYLSLSLPLAAVIFDTGSETYGEIVQKIYYSVFVKYAPESFSFFCAGIVFFVFMQTVVNLAVVLYRSFVRTKKAAFLIFIFMFIAVFATIKAADVYSGMAPFRASVTGLVWSCTLICVVFSLLYFFITVRLFERKVEL